MLQNELASIGLDDKESLVYTGLLELGEANIMEISKKSGVKRTTVYDVLNSLKEKGLLGLTKRKNRTYYFAENPHKLEQQIEEKRATIQKILPQLLSITNNLDRKPKIRFFEGVDGIKEVYKDTLNYPDQEIQAWASHEAIKFFDIDYLWQSYVPARLEKKIWTRVIAPDNKDMRHLSSYDEKHLRQIRLVPHEEMFFEVEINLYGKRNIGIMVFQEQIGLIIESHKLYNTLKSIFEMNWKALGK